MNIIEKLSPKVTKGEWISIVAIAEKTDKTPEELSRELIALAREGRIILIPESNTKALTEMDHLYAVRFGGQDKHAFCWI